MVKRVLLLAGPAVALIAAIGPPFVLTLPDPLAVHWTLSGHPDGHGSATVDTLIVAACIAVLLFLLAVRSRGARLTVAPWAWGASFLLAGLQWAGMSANAGVADWHDATLQAPPVIAAVAVAVIAALTAVRLERSLPATPHEPVRTTLGLGPGESAAWFGRTASTKLAALAGVFAIAMVALGLFDGGWFVVVAGIFGACAIAFVSEISATVDARGLTVAFGPFGWPRQHVPLEDVSSAEAIEVDPMKTGGWGIRFPRGGGLAVVVRGGDGIRVVRRDGRQLIVTLPDAATAAALLNDLRARTAGP
jgi:hypothetical protein